MEAPSYRNGYPGRSSAPFRQSEEVANICVYAASPQPSATTDAALRVEGGIIESIS